jgi:hypothetical protein
MSKKIILHIGCEKTGTTSIQNTLFLNKQMLSERDSVLYPQSLGGKNHWKIAVYACDEDKNLTRFLKKGEALEVFREKLELEFMREVESSDAKTVIISNEWLHPRVKQQSEFERLKRLLLKVTDDIQVIMYIRRQDKMAMSLYSTALKAGNYKRFTFPNVNNEDMLPYYYDFLRIYHQWTQFFGVGALKIRIFDRVSLFEGDAVKDFFAAAGLRQHDLQLIKEDNLSISDFGIKLMRGLNMVLYKLRALIKPQLARSIRHKVARLFPGKPVLANNEEAQAFLKAFKQCNEQLLIDYQQNSGELLDDFYTLSGK